MRRKPPAVDFEVTEELLGPANSCPVEGCDVWIYPPDEPDCEHEYPGRCAACDTIVGDRYADLVWMGRKLGADQWLCERCRGYCEECDSYGKVTLDGVCGDCCRIVTADGTVLHAGEGVNEEGPTVQLLWSDEPKWYRIDGGIYCEACEIAEVEDTLEFFEVVCDGETHLVCWSCLLGRPTAQLCGGCHKPIDPENRERECCDRWWETHEIRLPVDAIRRLQGA